MAEAGGLLTVIAKTLRPLMVRAFPEVPADHPAMGAMIGVWGAMERKVRLATAVSGVSERPELAPSDRFRYGERVASQQVDVLVAER